MQKLNIFKKSVIFLLESKIDYFSFLVKIMIFRKELIFLMSCHQFNSFF